MPPDREDRLEGVSRETNERLEVYAATLKKWNPAINLVSPTTLEDIWSRHIRDCAQLISLAPNADNWLDLGAGGGLPGLVVAALMKEQAAETKVTLVESDQRKCAFMRTAANEMNVDVNVKNTRIEALESDGFDVISARALAPLDRLLDFAEPHTIDRTICLFLKGERLSDELTEARFRWHILADRLPSQTNPEASILRVKEFSRVVST